jgi:hypothetical protein
MRTRPRNRALVGIPFGLLIMAGAFFLNRYIPAVYLGSMLVAFCGFLIYVWGCAELAKAKGYESAIVLTAIFLVIPAVILILILPDKNKTTKRW